MIFIIVLLTILFIYWSYCSPEIRCSGGAMTELKPMSLDERKKLVSSNDDTKFLYDLMTNKDMRMIIIFDNDDHKVPEHYWYKKEIVVSENQGRGIYYQVANIIGGDIDVDDYPKKNNYNIYIYFLCGDYEGDSKFVTNNFRDTVILAKLFLNDNSLDAIKYQNFSKFTSKKFQDNWKIINSFINKVYDTISLYQQEQFVVVHGVITSFLGLRPANDIDIAIYDNHTLARKLSNIKIPLEVDVLVYDGNLYRQAKDSHIHGIKNIQELFFNKNKYMYINGIKCHSVFTNLQSRFARKRPNAVAEIIAFNQYNPENKYRIPVLPTKIYNIIKPNCDKPDGTIEDNLKFIKDYKVISVIPQYRYKLISHIRSKLKDFYDIGLSDEEISRMVPTQ